MIFVKQHKTSGFIRQRARRRIKAEKPKPVAEHLCPLCTFVKPEAEYNGAEGICKECLEDGHRQRQNMKFGLTPNGNFIEHDLGQYQKN